MVEEPTRTLAWPRRWAYGPADIDKVKCTTAAEAPTIDRGWLLGQTHYPYFHKSSL